MPSRRAPACRRGLAALAVVLVVAALAVTAPLPEARAAVAVPAAVTVPESGYAYDPVGVNDCRNRATAARADPTHPFTWTKNHYAYCQVSYQGGEFFSAKTNRGLGGVAFRATLVGAGSNTDRAASFTLYIDDVLTEITPIDGAVEGFNPDAVTVRAAMDCAGSPSAGACVAGSGNGLSQTVGKWKNSSSNTARFSFRSPVSSGVTAGPGAAERIARGTFRVRLTFTHPESLPGADQFGPQDSLRFDSASYMAARHQNGAIFPVTSWITFSLQDPKAPYSILHIWLAQHHPDLTYPIVTGKTIGGYNAAHPLTRLVDKTRAQRNNDVSRALCMSLDPGYVAHGDDCDEYPFKSTYQGAALAHGNSSVMTLPLGDNRSSGSRLGNWYATDRVLDGDPFYVHIVGNPPAHLPRRPIFHLP